MTEWIALLRGVNVGGITIRNAELAEVFRGLGFDDVRTVLASGNVLFRAERADRAAVKSRIEAALRARFDYDARILLVTPDEVRGAAQGFPFDTADDQRHSYVVFCLDTATRDELAALAGAEDDVAPGEGVVYWSTPRGTTVDSPFGKALARAAFRTRTTNRNLRTLRRLTP